ncbi:MAG: PA0069 family radical SAM protein [Alphaproteobacteria bacterium]|nr:PA0069 family radical SAM protein [Alphaproteobacteria bacterium]MCD8570487.1 PA0069 family radical SAM protein [Alphaproteobacteria bacterium]
MIHKPKPLTFHAPIRGRGARENPTGRFESRTWESDAETYNALLEANVDEPGKQVPTQVFRDTSRSIISTNDSPDLVMDSTINPYKGCEHGCIYCYARPMHEYLGMSAGIDFETKIFMKDEAAQLLRQEISCKSWKPRTLVLSGATDPYQPLEREKKITRACLEVLRDFHHPAAIITKNNLVTRDIDIFQDMAGFNTIIVNLSITTLDAKLARHMEPRASTPSLRLRALETLAKAGIPVGVIMGPVLPGLTEHEIPAILKAAANAGAETAGFTILRLPHGVKDLFQSWLAEHYPDRAGKILNRLRAMHNGKLYDSNFGTRRTGTGIEAEQIAKMFAFYRKRYGLTHRRPLTTEHFRRDVGSGQMSLF